MSCATVLAMVEVAAPATCTTVADCPALVCRTATACTSGRCEYTQVAAKTPCPGKGCSNGRLHGRVQERYDDMPHRQ
ncbi:hypothetical protein ACHHYP_20756 [Achlya hypogyna]|uniref:Secreted protein n=1 Tax=Achlya hypogyna TaxID=1202772 RepID=A0A1V9YBY0_ACHHY|nr:hypothetical protein ACHHYP_20756 [Achlya hypogyna]